MVVNKNGGVFINPADCVVFVILMICLFLIMW